MRVRSARALLFAAAALGSVFLASHADASVSISVLFDDLVKESTTVDVVTPVEARSLWENGRIYTYTRVHVDNALAGGAATGADLWVQTLGGEVGDVGQLVEGEPNLVVGKSFLVFLRPSPAAGTYWVTARAQGQFPLRADGSGATAQVRVIKNASMGALLAPRPDVVVLAQKRAPAFPIAAMPAADALHERTVDAAAKEIRDAWTRTHAR
ncbi:hypothetical protein BH09MYX1_BH09MYX1_43340 [soil metagenome]